MSDYYAKKKEESDKRIQAALEARKKQKESSETSLAAKKKASDSRIEAALAARSKRVQSSLPSVMSDIESLMTVEMDSYNSTKPSYGNYDATYQSQRERRIGISNLRSKVKAYRNYMDDGVADNLLSALDQMERGYDAYLAQSRYASEKEYNKAVEQAKAAEESRTDMLNFNLDAGQREIDELEAVKAEYEDLKRKVKTLAPSQSGDATRRMGQIYQQYGDLDALISQKKAYLTRASRAQEGVKLASASGNADFDTYKGYISTESDGWWDKLTSQYGLGYEDLTYEYINGAKNGMRSEIINKAIAYNADSSLEATDKWKIYNHMTADEIDVYNYYYARDGREAAEKYLDSIRETLEQRKAAPMFENIEDKTLLELAFGVVAGLDQFESGMKNFFNTDDSYIPQSAIQIASGMVREDLSDTDLKWYNFKEGSWEDTKIFGNSLGQVGYDAINTTANMAPSMLASIAIGSLSKSAGTAFAAKALATAGQAAGSGLMGMSAAGNAYQEALNLGYDKSQARAYSNLVGASEAGLQYLLGGISNMGGKVSGAALTKMLNGIDNAYARAALKLGGNMLSEGFEEGLQEILTPLFKNWALQADEDINWSEVAYSSLLGALTAGVMEGDSTISGEVNVYKTGKQLQAADISAQRLAEIGKTFSADTVAYQLAGRVNENTGAYTIGRLFNEIGATLTEQNVNDITQELVAKGMDTTTARKNARAMAVVVEGGNLSDLQVKAIEANDVLADAVRTTLIDSNSTWYQRSKGYNEALMALAQEKASENVSGRHSDKTREGVAVPENTATPENINAPEGISEAAHIQQPEAQQENDTAVDVSDVRDEKISYAVSEDGQTTRKSTGEAVSIQKITSIENGKMTLQADTGATVDAEDVSFASRDEAMVYEAVADLSQNASVANILLTTFQMDQIPGEIYARGIREAYEYGKFNFTEQEMMRHGSYVRDLTEHQRNVAYKLGQLFAGKQVAKKVAGIRKNKKDGQKAPGKVHFDGDRSRLNHVQKAGLDAMELLSKTLGVEFYVFESQVDAQGNRQGENGWYDPSDGSIHIDLYAGGDGKGTILFTVAHELTHFIRQWSPAKFKILANYLMKQYSQRNVSTTELINEQIAKAKRTGRTIDRDTAFEELVADSMETMLSDGKILQTLTDIREQDRSLCEKIMDWFKEFSEKLKGIVNAYRDVKPDSVEGRLVADMKDVISDLEALFGDALLDASENFNSAAQKNTAKGGDVKYSFAGRTANSADLTAFEMAQKLDRDGINGENIRQKTGWFRGMDGKWRFEIDDSAMLISEDISNYMSLGELLHHPKLYRAYPDMKHIDVVFQSLGEGVYGSYNPQFDSINLDYSLKNVPEAIKNALIHELQHAIQHREGFTRGTTVESWERKRKQGFDSRRKEDIRKAQETERELSRIQDEDPEFYRDMLELDAMTPNLPRGKIDWDTLEQIEDDPIEWQRYDARREELETRYGEMKVWDANDLLYHKKQAAKNMGRAGIELYFDTAGEIEARDVESRRRLSDEQRKTSPPKLGNEDTVFAEGEGVSAVYIGDTKDGRRCYQSEYGADVSMDKRVEMFKERISTIFNLGAVELKTDVKKIRVRGDKFTSQKNIYGDHFNQAGEQAGKINSLYDLADILATAKYDPTATAKEPSYENPEQKPKNKAHKGVKYWYKFRNEIVFDGVPYTVTFNIRDKGGEQYQYLIDFKENKTPGLSNTAVKSLLRADQMSYGGIVAQTDNTVNMKLSARDPAQQKIQEALEQENARLKEDVSRLEELVKLQRTGTGGAKFTKTSVEAAARLLKKNANAKGDTKELTQLLHTFYETVASDKKPSWDKIKKLSQPAVQWLQDHVDIKEERSEYAQTILDQMRGSKIYLDESQKAEAAHRFGSYNDFRKSLFGRITLVAEGETSLDSWWQAMAEEYPDVFHPGITSTDMPGELLDIIDQLKNADTSRVEYEYNRASIAMDLTRQIYDSYWKVSTLYTVADKAQSKIDELKYKHYKQMAELRAEKNAKIDQIKEQNRASREKNVDGRKRTEERRKIRRVIRELYKLFNRGKDQRNVKQGMRDVVATALASADVLFDTSYTDDDMIRKGVRYVKLSSEASMLLNQAKDILAELENAPAAVDLDGMSDWYVKEQKLKTRLSKLKSQLKPIFVAEHQARNGTLVSKLMDDLCNAYKELANSDKEYIKAAFDPNVVQYLEGVKNGFGVARVGDMRLDQLEALHKAYTMVLTSVRNANKAFVSGKPVELTAKKMLLEFERRKMPKKKITALFRNTSNAIGWDYEKLHYALDRIGSETLTELFNNLANAENITMADIQEAKLVQSQMVEKHGYNKWAVDKVIDKEFVDNTGQTFRLTLGELMSLYAYSRRENAWKHIEYGGFVFAKNRITATNTANTYKLNKRQCKAITDTLTAEQKAFVEEMQTFLSDVMGGKGNEISMELYGVEMFGEKNYFPIHVSGDYKQNAQESQAKEAAGFASMKNAGFTQAQNKQSTAPFIMEDFMNVWADHVNEMSRYHGAVPALEDIRRVMNFSVYSDSNSRSTSVKAAMKNAFGDQASKYFDAIYREANSGAITDKLQEVPRKLLSMFRKNSVMYSASVLIQQPASMYRACAMIDWKYFGWYRWIGNTAGGTVKMLFNKWTKAETKTYAEMMKYAPGVTMAKEIGGFDTTTGSSIRGYLLDTEKSFFQKIKTGTVAGKLTAAMDLVDNNFLANLPNVADKIAWIEIWNACKRETAVTHKELVNGSEAFMECVGKRFSEVIRATQVYDSMFAKSPWLKSKNLAVQYCVSFMNEPNVVANMAESAIRDLSRGDGKKAVRKAAAVVRSIIVTNLFKTIIYAMRDDDEDETFIEKYAEALAGGLLSDMNPLNYIPLVRDVWSVLQGYDVDRPDMAVLADAISALNKTIESGFKDTSDMTEEELFEWDRKVSDAGWKLAEAAVACFGIPLKNIRREINAVINTAETVSKNFGLTTWSGLKNAVLEGAADSAPVFFKKAILGAESGLYEAIVQGNSVDVNRLKSGYKDETAYNNAIRKALRENDPRIKEAAQAKFSGDLDKYLSLAKAIIAEKHFSQDNVVAAINAEINALDKGEKTTSAPKASGIFNAEDFAMAISQNDSAMANTIKTDIIQTAQKNGKTAEEAEKSFTGSAKTYLKDLFLEGGISESKAISALTAYCGEEQENAEQRVAEWQFESNHGFKYDEKKQMFMEGEISASELKSVFMQVEDKTDEEANSSIVSYARDAYDEGYFDRSQAASIMVSYGGLTQDEAVSKLQYIDVKKQFPDTYVDDAWVVEYYKEIEPSGISIKVFVDYRNRVKGITGDGKKARRMEVINSMPISNAQKDALYFAEGWAESKLNEAPWH